MSRELSGRVARTQLTLLAYLKAYYDENDISPSTIADRAQCLDAIFHFSLVQSSEWKSFMRIIVNRRGPVAQDNKIFSVKDLLHFIAARYGDNSILTQPELTSKLCTLIALFFGLRPSDIARIRTPDFRPFTDLTADVQLTLQCVTKQSRLRSEFIRGHFEYRDMNFKLYSDPRLCVARALKVYLKLTERQRKPDDYLFLFVTGRGGCLGSQRIGNIITAVLKAAGLEDFTAKHCRRSAASSVAENMSFNEVLEFGDWKDVECARRHYLKARFQFNDVMKALQKD